MAGAGAVAGLVGFTGAPAFASGITVDPAGARRGEEVTITGYGCRGGVDPDTGVSISGRAIATAQDAVTSGRFSTTTKVRLNAPLGRSTITAVCQMSGQKLTGTVTVKWDREGPPRRWPRTGGGGMAASMAASMAADEDGTPMLGGLTAAAGLGLLAGAVGIGGFTLVRSRRARSRGES
jgi:hypothetical protein